ncbi:MAG: glycoside hydrolase family 127 protein [Clostridiales bacterium]|nr:glycoside hydrolase family 127 protein [Clostridiales bacterium]
MKTSIIDKIPVNISKDNQVSSIATKKLTPGSIKANGWLKTQLSLMVEGVTGRLYEYGKYFSKEKNGWFYGNDNGWEEIPYWLRGAYPLAVLTSDKRLLTVTRDYIHKILSSQNETGFFGPSGLQDILGKNGKVTTDLWPAMLLLEPIIQYYEYEKDDLVLPFLHKFFKYCKNMPDKQFILEDTKGNYGWGGGTFGSFSPFLQYSRAGDMLPHIWWLYQKTNEEYLLKLAKRFYDKIRPPMDEWLDHHAVNFAQRFAYDGLYSVFSKEKQHIKNSEYWYNMHMATWGQMPKGIFAADERIRPGCTDPRQGFETCGMIEFARNFTLLSEITGDPIYAQRTEDIMLNHFPAAHTPDYKALHYITAANMPKLSGYHHHPIRNGFLRSNTSYLAYTPYNRCCGHNDGIGWTGYTNNLWQHSIDNGLVCLLYASCTINTTTGNEKTPIKLIVDTNYPFDETISVSMSLKNPTTFPLYFRIPDWCSEYKVIYNNNEILSTNKNSCFVQLINEFSHNDKINIIMKAITSLTTWPNKSVTVNRGPLSYSLKIEENWFKLKNAGAYQEESVEKWPSFEVHPNSPWNYGLLLNDNNQLPQVTINKKSNYKGQPFTFDNAPIEITLKAKKIPNWTLQDDTASKIQPSPVYSDQPTEDVTLIPLGCAHLRMACLPIVTDDKKSYHWQKVPSHIEFSKRPKNKFDELEPKIEEENKDV